jgi:hypothetical protein
MSDMSRGPPIIAELKRLLNDQRPETQLQPKVPLSEQMQSQTAL